MKVSRSTSYGLMAVCYIAKNQKNGIIQSGEIAKKYDIPLEYLLKILQDLVKAGVLRSKRGPGGAYVLTRSAKKINLLQIIEAVEGVMVNNLALEEHAKGVKFCKRVDQAYGKAIAQARVALKKVTLSDLVA